VSKTTSLDPTETRDTEGAPSAGKNNEIIDIKSFDDIDGPVKHDPIPVVEKKEPEATPIAPVVSDDE